MGEGSEVPAHTSEEVVSNAYRVFVGDQACNLPKVTRASIDRQSLPIAQQKGVDRE